MTMVNGLVRHKARNNGMHCRRHYRKHSCIILKPEKSVKMRRDFRSSKSMCRSILRTWWLGSNETEGCNQRAIYIAVESCKAFIMFIMAS